MNQIVEIIYLPSLRCNLNCQHCGENQDVRKEDEVNCLDVLHSIKNSYMFVGNAISITGGEPFLNSSLIDFLLVGIKETDFTFYITSNGYFFEAIKQLVEQVNLQDRKRLIFSISIDGLEETHNEIRRNALSFQKAMKTIRFLAENNVPVNINTVAQEKNLDELEQLKKHISEISPNIVHSIIPLAVDISEEKTSVYTDRYKQYVWENVNSAIDKKRILSEGAYGVKNCHAGLSNIVIASDGKVYPCLTGGFYRGVESRERFCIGDLKCNTLDEILVSERRKLVYENEVSRCDGCTNPCEVNREVNVFGQSLALREDEIRNALQLEKNRKIGDALLDYTGWHAIETYGEEQLCWSNEKVARIYVPKDDEKRNLKIKYRMLNPKIPIKVLVNGKEVSEADAQESNVICIQLPMVAENYYCITFLPETVCSPYELQINDDMRVLGIGLESAVLLKE